MNDIIIKLQKSIPQVNKEKLLLKVGIGTIIIFISYILDVWLIGSLTAYMLALGKWTSSFNFGINGIEATTKNNMFENANYYLHHPISTALNWLKPNPLHPEVRLLWFTINILLLGGIATLILYKKLKGAGLKGLQTKDNDITHGSATWAEKNDLKRVVDFGFGPGILLGAFMKTPLRIPIKLKTWMNKHILVIGAPGSGKSRGYVRPNIIMAVRSGESCIATDPKGELYNSMAPWLRKKGYIVKAINLVDMECSDRWNPTEEIIDEIDADIFARVVIDTTSTGHGGDAFWDRAEQNLLKALVLYVCYDHQGNRRHGKMSQIYDLIAAGDPGIVDEMFNALPPKHIAKGPYNVFAMAGETVRGNVIIGLGTRLQVFQQAKVRSITETSEIDLTLPGKEKCAYFVITPDTHGAFDFLASLFFTFLMVQLVKEADKNKGPLKVPLELLLDEFANIVSIPEFEKKIATVRSRGINCHVIIQGLPQLERKYGKAWQEIKACCDTTLVLGVKDDYTARYISNMLGQGTVETTTKSKNGILDERHSYGATGRALMTPDEVMKMRSKTALLFLPDGTPPAKLKVIDYEECPEAKELNLENIEDKKEKTTGKIIIINDLEAKKVAHNKIIDKFKPDQESSKEKLNEIEPKNKLW